MVFVKKEWQNGRAGKTPVNKTELDRIEAGIEEAHGRLGAITPASIGALDQSSGDARYAPLPTGTVGTSWQAAWSTRSTATLRAWFESNTGSRVSIDTATPIVGQVTITSQADASALVGRQINGNVVVAASNIDLHDFVVKGDNTVDNLISCPGGYSGHRIHDIELDGQYGQLTVRGIGGHNSTGTLATGMTVERVRFRRLVDGPLLHPSSAYRYNYVYDPFQWNTAVDGVYDPAIHPHSDGMQAVAGDGITVVRNFVDVTPTTPSTVSGIIIKSDAGPITNFLVEENYLNGGTKTVFVLKGTSYPDPTGTFRGNRFGTGYSDGLWSIDTATPTFTDNVWAEDLSSVPVVYGVLAAKTFPSLADPMNLGMVPTVLSPFGNAQVWSAANDARYLRCLSGGKVRYIGLNVAVSSGNISVGVYRSSGTGQGRQPTTLLASSGSIPCPAAGYVDIDLGQTVDVLPGDYLAMSCDNATASFIGNSAATADRLASGFVYSSGTSHPLPTTPTVPFAGSSFRVPFLVGHI